MVGEITEAELMVLRAVQEHSGHKVAIRDPRVAKTKALYETYHSMFPEVKDLLNLASETAEERGYVMTIMGRRARFREGDRMYSALNRVIQGTAADDHKMALVDVHNERHQLGFTPRFTVHDELYGDLVAADRLPAMAQFLNQQRLECKVPILWAANVGPSWAESK
jgi:DNA polymerase-1